MAVSILRAATLLLALVAASDTCLAQADTTTASGRFKILDRNGDGVVSKLEYNSDALFSAMDTDHNNRISEKELQAILGPQWDGELSAADRIGYADSNSDGELDDEELRRHIEARFRLLDVNKDDEVDLPELKSRFGIP